MVVPMSAKIGDKRCSLNSALDLFLFCEVGPEGAALRFDMPLVRVGDREGERVRFGDIWKWESDDGGMTGGKCGKLGLSARGLGKLRVA